ncbi:conserved exported protein of unknown function [Candidatus Filomicrobium marinum]|uniref:Right handed beta helix domain-containing protein n=1 Tax=Candidatus Filomicrobium marinum TaxID=1608628 RepID=A0A0D6JEW0_9HYPH|nr:right-handed parallel beta-helix repeat-containing protein [Candidatus Filomicrobium marinum]CFX22872.1 conserved exported protein of unknown function [Candidatus Filomicrobium marinum]CPR18970.1 conserved exported protein of unknown function [Candidatus Filomicrobium marinum]
MRRNPLWRIAILMALLFAISAVGQSNPSFAQSLVGGEAKTEAIVILVPADLSEAVDLPATSSGHRPTARTLGSALKLARTLRRQSAEPVSIVIELSAGVHRLKEPIELTSDDGGTDAVPLIIRGTSSGTATLRGSVVLELTSLPSSHLTKLTDKARAAVQAYRLPEFVRSATRVDVPRVHDRLPDLIPFEVFDAAGPLIPARWPNEGFAPATSLSVDGSGTKFALKGANYSAWADEPDLWANGNFRWNWNYQTIPIVRAAPADAALELAAPPQFGFGSDFRIFISHALSELDMPGEWYRDRDTGTLVVWPRPEGGPPLEISLAPHLFEILGARNIQIENLALERVRGSAIKIEGGANIAIRDVTIRDTGGVAASINNARESGIESCNIARTGEGGVVLSGGDRPSLTPANLYVRDCRIRDFSRLGRMYRPGIRLDGVGNTARGNYLCDAPHTAISFSGNDHLIELNEITSVLTDTSDAGAIDTGRDWTGRGTIIRNNFLHDLRGQGEGFEVKGVYLDDFTSGTTVEGNVFLRVEQPVFIGGGRDNVARKNVMINSEPGVHIDGRGMTWNGELVWNTDRELRQRLAAMPISSARWMKRYPHLADILSDDPARPKRNTAEGNLFVSGVPYRIYPEVEESGQALQQPLTPSEIGVSSPAKSRLDALKTARDIPTILGEDILSAAQLQGLPYDRMDRGIILPQINADEGSTR